ncbi:MAG: pyridoxal phosphate-dependent decarboxylase family protein [Aestuariivirga sp.]
MPLPPSQADTLGLTEAHMRALGYQMVDMVVKHWVGRAHEPAVAVASRKPLEAKIGGAVPQEPSDPAAALASLRDLLLPYMQHGDHPRYFARVPGPSSFAAILGDWLATGFNAMAATWVGGSGPATLELVVIDWLRQLLGMPEETQGVIVSGGSMANFTAFAAAFAAKGRGVVYLNDQTHASLKRNFAALGAPPEDVRVLPTGRDLKFNMAELAALIVDDRAQGRKPVMIVATAGSTNTGACDPLPEIAALCKANDLWMHVDGAYGAPAALTAKGRAHLIGMELADSLVLDPHKWLFQPYDCGCVLVRHPGALERAFTMNPEYLKDVMGGEGEVDFFNRSLELTRKARSLKLWMTFKTYGAGAISAAIARGIELAEIAQALIVKEGSPWELVTPAQIGIVTFARRNAKPGEHAAMVNDITQSGYATLSSTVIGGRSVLRLCTINPSTTEADIAETLQRLASMGR